MDSDNKIPDTRLRDLSEDNVECGGRSIGYNNRWLSYFYSILTTVAQNSKDPSTKVGAILIKDKRIIATGYNGFPVGVADDLVANADRYERPNKYDYVVHAEANVILQCAVTGVSTSGATLFVTHPPCVECTKLIIQAGISRIIIYSGKVDDEYSHDAKYLRKLYSDSGNDMLIAGDWRRKLPCALQMLKEAGVEIYEGYIRTGVATKGE